jgi:hypothetical protein
MVFFWNLLFWIWVTQSHLFLTYCQFTISSILYTMYLSILGYSLRISIYLTLSMLYLHRGGSPKPWSSATASCTKPSWNSSPTLTSSRFDSNRTNKTRARARRFAGEFVYSVVVLFVYNTNRNFDLFFFSSEDFLILTAHSTIVLSEVQTVTNGVLRSDKID